MSVSSFNFKPKYYDGLRFDQIANFAEPTEAEEKLDRDYRPGGPEFSDSEDESEAIRFDQEYFHELHTEKSSLYHKVYEYRLPVMLALAVLSGLACYMKAGTEEVRQIGIEEGSAKEHRSTLSIITGCLDSYSPRLSEVYKYMFNLTEFHQKS